MSSAHYIVVSRNRRTDEIRLPLGDVTLYGTEGQDPETGRLGEEDFAVQASQALSADWSTALYGPVGGFYGSDRAPTIELETQQLARHIQDTTQSWLDQLRDVYLHKEVTLLNTNPRQSQGRAAHITDIMISNGVPLFLCMVLRSGSETEYLNSETWTRAYRPASNFLLMEDEM
jgi:hypothetical protein